MVLSLCARGRNRSLPSREWISPDHWRGNVSQWPLKHHTLLPPGTHVSCSPIFVVLRPANHRRLAGNRRWSIATRSLCSFQPNLMSCIYVAQLFAGVPRTNGQDGVHRRRQSGAQVLPLCALSLCARGGDWARIIVHYRSYEFTTSNWSAWAIGLNCFMLHWLVLAGMECRGRGSQVGAQRVPGSHAHSWQKGEDFPSYQKFIDLYIFWNAVTFKQPKLCLYYHT